MASISHELPADGREPATYALLRTMDDPTQLRALERKQLGQLAA